MANESLHIECSQAKDFTKSPRYPFVWWLFLKATHPFLYPDFKNLPFRNKHETMIWWMFWPPIPCGGISDVCDAIACKFTVLPPGSPVLGQQIKNCTSQGSNHGMPWQALLEEHSWIENHLASTSTSSPHAVRWTTFASGRHSLSSTSLKSFNTLFRQMKYTIHYTSD